jgi:para-nitrobenzyl esterase
LGIFGKMAAACIALLPLTVVAAAAGGGPEVTIDSGRVRGAAEDGVLSWKGIPFAAPPIGRNRWRAPQPIHWSGTRQATEYGHDCMQKPFPSDAAPLGTEPAEDCLVLNVWRPAGVTKKLPVMVWIYGGGFVNGGSSPSVYSGAQFAKRGILFVSFNYRLGRFGFFAHPALSAAREGPLGNYAYMDQIAALKWVQRNAAAFGGDPANVTVFGESAGGSSTIALLTSPAASGLFKRVAVMSGGGRGSLLPSRLIAKDQPGVPSGETIGINFAKSVGVAGSGPAALAALRALPADRVLQGLGMMNMGGTPGAPQTYGGPMQDGVIVTAPPQTIFDAGRQNKAAIMIGSNGADIGFARASSMDELFKPFGAAADRARKLYDPANGGDLRSVASAVAMDSGMTEPARYAAGKVAAAGSPAYYYRFTYVAQSMRGEWKAAPHATDIPYFFDTVAAKYGDKLAPADAAMAQAANAYMANFAITGDPNGPGLPRWDAYRPGAGTVMDFTLDRGALFGPDPWRERLDVTESLAEGRGAAPRP